MPSSGDVQIIGMVGFFLIIGAFIGYLFFLQWQSFKACKEEKQMSVFFKSPAGLPEGTIRAFIALIIVTVSLVLIVLRAFSVSEAQFPEILSGVLGTVLGFYFGNRSATNTKDDIAKEQIKTLKTERDQIQVTYDTEHKDKMISKIKKGISMSKVAVAVLPEEVKKKYEGVITKLEEGVKTIEGLSGPGNINDALSKAKELYEGFQKENPAKGAFINTIQSFGKVLGGNAPAIAVASALIAVTIKLAGTAYQKWKARILHAPFSPAIIPLKVVDANTGFTLLCRCPIFKEAFSNELQENDRPFFESIVKILNQEDLEDFWKRYSDRFDSREQFEFGIEEFRRAAVDIELGESIPHELMAEGGGYAKLVGTIDKIHADPIAQAALDQMILTVENLQSNGEPVKTIFDKVKSEVSQ